MSVSFIVVGWVTNTSKRFQNYQPQPGKDRRTLPITNTQKDRVPGLPYSGFVKYTAIKQIAADTAEAIPERIKGRGKVKSKGKGKSQGKETKGY